MLENSKPSVEFEDINLKGNLEQGNAEINSLTKLEPSLDTYRDIKLEYSLADNIEQGESYIYLSNQKLAILFLWLQYQKTI